MNEQEEILQGNIEEYTELAEQAYDSGKYNSAATLYFKAICASIDLFLLRKEGEVPSSHTNRFRTVQEKYPEIYEMMDRDFPFYQDSYTKKISKEAVDILKEDAERIKKMSED